jgi:hypothetical protein
MFKMTETTAASGPLCLPFLLPGGLSCVLEEQTLSHSGLSLNGAI